MTRRAAIVTRKKERAAYIAALVATHVILSPRKQRLVTR
jgi:hypothetical protein